MDTSTPSNKEISKSDVYKCLCRLEGSEDPSRDQEFREILRGRIKRLPEEAEYTTEMLMGYLPLREPTNEKGQLMRIESSIEKGNFGEAKKWMKRLRYFYWREEDKKREEGLEMDLST